MHFTGRLDWESKNQLGLIRGLVDFPGKIVLIGQPSPQESKYYLACQEEASKRGNVVFIGHLPHEELPPIYQAAGVHVLPSWRETPGLASLEAAAAGCKVVSTSIGSAKEYFGEAAWYCHPMNLLSIKKRFLKLRQPQHPKILEKRSLTGLPGTVQQANHSTVIRWRSTGYNI